MSEQRTFRVTAADSHAAQVAAVRAARTAGLIVRTTSRVVPVAGHLWDVTLAVVVPA